VPGQRPCNACTDGVLDVVELRGGGVVPLGPQLASLPGLDELDRHAHGVSSQTHAAVHDVTRRGCGVRQPASSDRARMQHLQRAEARELRRDVFDEPLAK
jgi:hypothetical protein